MAKRRVGHRPRVQRENWGGDYRWTVRCSCVTGRPIQGFYEKLEAQKWAEKHLDGEVN